MTTYLNPVYPEYMADPFVLQHQGAYYAYGTAPQQFDGLVFRVLYSTDLVHWQFCGGALEPIEAGVYWAPEVAFCDGHFYMYYSAGEDDGAGHQLRVATSTSPLGPFKDSGHVLIPNQPFSIDAHPFKDRNGDWYLFYAQDFLDTSAGYKIGTGIVVDRMVDMTLLVGCPKVVIRPSEEWHLFKQNRPMYGQIFDWYTIEGPAVLERDGHYYCFFSGGAWERQNYGIGYVIAEHPLGPYRSPDISSPIFGTIPSCVIGPGHNSFTRSPDGQEEFIIYHAWDPEMSARLMRIDRVQWVNGTPRLIGPTWTPQPIPGTQS